MKDYGYSEMVVNIVIVNIAKYFAYSIDIPLKVIIRKVKF